MIKLFTYIIAHDTGFAPCYDNGIFSLACCKPRIRRSVYREIDKYDSVWICGVKRKEKKPFIVYLAKIDKAVLLYEYYSNNEYLKRRDCVYRNLSEKYTEFSKGKISAEELKREHPFLKSINNPHGNFKDYNEFDGLDSYKKELIIKDISGLSVLLSQNFVHCSLHDDLNIIIPKFFKDVLKDYENVYVRGKNYELEDESFANLDLSEIKRILPPDERKCYECGNLKTRGRC